jgi:ABC-2 type transport system permease protein
MPVDVALLDLRLRRRAIVGYTIGIAVYVFVVVALYPAFKDATSLNDLTEGDPTLGALFGLTGSLTSTSGWLNANIYANFLPLVILLLTIGYGAACLAGQDEDGTLSLVVTLPQSRRAILAQKLATLVLQALPVALATLLLVLAGRNFDLKLSAGALVGTTVGVLLLGIDFGLLALLVGALTGSRGAALGITSGVAAASYLVSSLAPVTHWIHPLRVASLFYWSVGNDQLVRGLSTGSAAVLVCVAVALIIAAALAFDRLDVH